MYVMEYLIYHLRPYGLNTRFIFGKEGNATAKFVQLGDVDEELLYQAALAQAQRDVGNDDVFVSPVPLSGGDEIEKSNSEKVDSEGRSQNNSTFTSNETQSNPDSAETE